MILFSRSARSAAAIAVAWVNSSSIKFHAYSLFDGFGACPNDRSCTVRSHPPD